MSTTGVQRAMSDKIVWAHRCAPKDADPSVVYVFDAQGDTSDLQAVRTWLQGLGNQKAPLTVVISPKSSATITSAELDAFGAAIDSLDAYPLSRPDQNLDLLDYVQSLLPPPVAPGSYASEVSDAAPASLEALLRPFQSPDAAQRFD